MMSPGEAKRVEYGQFFMTRGIDAAMRESPVFFLEIQRAFARYIVQDWGDLCREDAKLNAWSLEHGERILAMYTTSRGKVYIITERDRSVTTILFAEEY
jgi:hypothetical protein